MEHLIISAMSLESNLYHLYFAELTKAMCHITEIVSLPLFTTIDKLFQDSQSKVNDLKEEKEYLQKQIRQIRELSK